MTSYSDVIAAMADEGFTLDEVDRILVNSETIEEWEEDDQFSENSTSDHRTIGGFAVRETTEDEHLVAVDPTGEEHKVDL